MAVIELRKQLGLDVLSTRPSARVLEPAMREAVSSGDIILDASGVMRTTVSFFDEALLIFDAIVRETGDESLRLVYRDAKAAQSLKSIPKLRGLNLVELASGDWIISK
ncbi:MAG: hypothetical protein OXL37_16250 [Chloroflexota bacterium]|nr:hypothetical protein [Chloroflexota bacterium]MDE2961443.1 hypothetical protein [Chloroflexota bacterium]